MAELLEDILLCEWKYYLLVIWMVYVHICALFTTTVVLDMFLKKGKTNDDMAKKR